MKYFFVVGINHVLCRHCCMPTADGRPQPGEHFNGDSSARMSHHCAQTCRRTNQKYIFKCAKFGLFSVYFRPFLNTMKNIAKIGYINGRSVDGVLGIRTRDRRLVGTDKSTDLWRPINNQITFASHESYHIQAGLAYVRHTWKISFKKAGNVGLQCFPNILLFLNACSRPLFRLFWFLSNKY